MSLDAHSQRRHPRLDHQRRLLAVGGGLDSCEGCPTDFNDDGDVNAADLAILLGNWGPCE